MSSSSNFQPASSKVFWGEIAPCEHIAQFYADDGVLLDTLTGFVGGGLKAGETTIVIATADHLKALEQRLSNSGLDIAIARSNHQYIDMLAEEALDKFMVAHWPDDQLFNSFITDLITRARTNSRRVRAFGEMVAILGHEVIPRQLFGSNIFGSSCAKLRTFRFSAPIQRQDLLTTRRTR